MIAMFEWRKFFCDLLGVKKILEDGVRKGYKERLLLNCILISPICCCKSFFSPWNFWFTIVSLWFSFVFLKPINNVRFQVQLTFQDGNCWFQIMKIMIKYIIIILVLMMVLFIWNNHILYYYIYTKNNFECNPNCSAAVSSS